MADQMESPYGAREAEQSQHETAHVLRRIGSLVVYSVALIFGGWLGLAVPTAGIVVLLGALDGLGLSKVADAAGAPMLLSSPLVALLLTIALLVRICRHWRERYVDLAFVVGLLVGTTVATWFVLSGGWGAWLAD